jgi:hypothetical protein
MAVAVSLNTGSGKFYNTAIGTIPISFSSLRSNFKEVTTGSVKASELRRNVNVNEANPIVPDSTENSDISTNLNWKVSQFYESIKYYDLVQTGTNDNISDTSNYGLNISSQSWNSNLGKNIKKVFYVDGTIGSVSVSREAAYFSAQSYNFAIELRSGGQILGAGGARNSGNGGNALYAESTGSLISIILGNSSTIKGGGGGGARGADGWTGPNGPCWIRRTYTTGGGCNCEWYPECGNPNTPVTINGTQYNSKDARRYGGHSVGGGCNCFIWCSNTCIGPAYCEVYDPTQTPGAPGGIGGNGGLGQGYNQTRTDAITTLNVTNGPTSGTSASCPNYATSGENGKTGGNGGDWAKNGGNTTRTDIQTLINAFYVSPSSDYNGSSGGFPGRAISGSNYTTSGRTDLIVGAK